VCLDCLCYAALLSLQALEPECILPVLLAGPDTTVSVSISWADVSTTAAGVHPMRHAPHDELTVHSRPCPVVHRRDHCGEQVCIAGDPLQLNGKITSQQAAAYGLAISLQERLMCSPAYHCTDPTTPSGYRCVLVLPLAVFRVVRLLDGFPPVMYMVPVCVLGWHLPPPLYLTHPHLSPCCAHNHRPPLVCRRLLLLMRWHAGTTPC
jgi:hypothetical protein